MNAMNRNTDTLITQLVGELEPVRPVKAVTGLAAALGGLALMLALVVLLIGVRSDVLAGNLNPVFVLAAGLFFLLGLASAATVIVMSRPRVGSDHGGWKWAAAMAGLLPLAALANGLGRTSLAFSGLGAEHGLDCLAMGSLLGLVTLVTLVWWLRRGAPTSPERAGLLTGIAAGSFGIFAFSFHCAYSDIVHIGLWHSLVVLLGAVAGRLAVPPLIRW